MAHPEVPTFDHGQRRQKIVDELLRDIFQGRLTDGQHLVTRELAERFHVSHTPIREALIAMDGLGVVRLHPNRGAVVQRVTTRAVNEICTVRRVLECEAVRTACGQIEPARLNELAQGFHRLEESDTRDGRTVAFARELDNALHDLIAERCGNTFLAAEIARLKGLFRAFRDVAWEQVEAMHDLRRVVEEAGEHLAIVDALNELRCEDAVRAMGNHIKEGGGYWRRAVEHSVSTASSLPAGDRDESEVPR